jgi:glycosyltransferase involved in cell wall biosynthesis
MACEVPVVATNRGGLPEVVKHGETGYLTEVGDCAAMAGHVIELMQDAEARKRMGANGRRRTIELFSKEKVVAQYEALYDSL